MKIINNKKEAIDELKRISTRTNSENNNKVNKLVEDILQEVKNYGDIAVEKYTKNPNEDNKNLVKTSLNKAFSLIDKAVKKNVLHKNNGANKKSKINNFVKTTLTTK